MSRDLNSFELFEQHYLEAATKCLQDDNEKASKLNQIHKEIFETWKEADIEVIEEYERLCPNYPNYIINISQDEVLRSTRNRIYSFDYFGFFGLYIINIFCFYSIVLTFTATLYISFLSSHKHLLIIGA